MAAGDVIVVRENAGSRKGNYFDGTDDYVLHDAHAVARVAANDTVGTYSVWIYKNSLTTDGCILSAGDNDSATELFKLWFGGSYGIKGGLYSGGAYKWTFEQTTALQYLTAKEWIHIALVQDGVRPALYINGVKTNITFTTTTDLTSWWSVLDNCDKFAIGVLESNNTHTLDFNGAIGQVKYWSVALTAQEVKAYYDYEAEHISSSQLTTTLGSARETVLNAALQFNVTMENDGTTDSGLGADNGTLTGNAHYGGDISTWSMAIERNSSGHAAEFINTFKDGNKYISVIKRGD